MLPSPPDREPPVVVPPVVPPVVVPPEAFTLARVIGPKKPAAGEMPLAAWYAARAAFVCAPKNPVAPAEMLKPLLISQF